MARLPKARAVDVDLFAALEGARYAGFWRRLAAQWLDFVWQVPLIVVSGWAVYGAVYFDDANDIGALADTLLSYGLPAGAVLMFWWWRGASPGKWLLGIRIVDAVTFQPASAVRLALRYFAYWVSAIPLMLGFVWIGFDARKQGWHDKIARTLVIYDDDF